MKFVITGGGTAGHIYPAIAVGKELEANGHEVLFAGTPNGLEARLAPEAGFDFKEFEVAGFNRRKPLTLITSSIKAFKSSKAAKRWLADIEPDAVIGFGGYVSIPVGKAAKDMRIPLVIHEQNSASGMANKYLASRAAAIALTYEAAAKYFKADCPMILTGNPVRAEFLAVEREPSRKMLGIPAGDKLLFVFGGSQGARHINTAITALAPKLMEIEGLHVIHICGPKEYDTVKAALGEHGIECSGPGFTPDGGWENPGQRYALTGYFNNMGEALAASDVVVARAGATSLAEIMAVGAATLLVPFPFATDDHQTKNAQALVESGASLMCADDKVESDEFTAKLFELLENDELRRKMSEMTFAMGRKNAAKKVAALAIAAANGNIEVGEIDAI